MPCQLGAKLWGDATTSRDAGLQREGGENKLALPFPHSLPSCLRPIGRTHLKSADVGIWETLSSLSSS